jgi:hypothetical protein
MNPRYLSICEQSHGAIRRRWADLLQCEAGWRGVESNALFTDLMERMLRQLWSALRAPTAARAACTPEPVALPQVIPGRCRLELHLPFLGSGRRALSEVLAGADGPGAAIPAVHSVRFRWELIHAFEASAQQAMEQVCGHCRIGRHCVPCGRGGPGTPGRS